MYSLLSCQLFQRKTIHRDFIFTLATSFIQTSFWDVKAHVGLNSIRKVFVYWQLPFLSCKLPLNNKYCKWRIGRVLNPWDWESPNLMIFLSYAYHVYSVLWHPCFRPVHQGLDSGKWHPNRDLKQLEMLPLTKIGEDKNLCGPRTKGWGFPESEHSSTGECFGSLLIRAKMGKNTSKEQECIQLLRLLMHNAGV